MSKTISGIRRRRILETLGAACVSVLILISPVYGQGLPFTENFSADTLKAPAPATTADWDTIAGTLKLPLTTSAAPVQSLTGVFLPGAASASVDVGSPAATRTMAIGDLDGDGDLDIAYGNNGANAIYFNDGFGGFSRGSEIPLINDQFGGNTRSMRIADFNGDGYMDLLYTDFGNSRTNRILFNNGSGGPQIFTSGDFEDLGPANIKGDSTAIGDVDNDGDIDIVLGVFGDYVQLFRNDGYGHFAAPEDVVDSGLSSAGFHAMSVVLGDIDNDNDLDLVAALALGSTRIYRNDGNGNYNVTTLVAGGGATNNLSSSDSAALGDLNGDGLLDLIIGNDGSGVSGVANRIYLNQSNPDIFPAVSFSFSDSVSTNSVRVADVDRDGDLDIVTGDLLDASTADSTKLYLNNGAGVFPANGTTITANVNFSRSIGLADLDGDGDLDLALANDSTINQVVLNTGALSGNNADQFYATAQSLRVDNNEDLSDGLIMNSTEANSIANPAFTYWMSSDAGLNWVAVRPGRSIGFPAPVGNDLRWKIDISTSSTAALWRPAVDSLVLTANRAPQFTSAIPPITATQGILYTFAITANDPDPESIDIRSDGPLPTWLTINDNGNGTATLEGTPTNDDVGANAIVLRVADGAGLGATQSFTITVADANDFPTVILPTGDQVYDQGDIVSLDASLAFEDVDLDPLTYSATSLPANLAIDPVSGVITGTLTNDDVVNGPVYNVTVTADDGNGGTIGDMFTITVTDVNDAPVFNAPLTAATEAILYTYNITATDGDGDAVTITSGALPGWLTFTDLGGGTATLTGTPAASDLGAVAITLTADDTLDPTTQMFTIVVSATPPPPPPPPPPRSSGGGSFGPLGILLLGSLVALGRRRRIAAQGVQTR